MKAERGEIGERSCRVIAVVQLSTWSVHDRQYGHFGPRDNFTRSIHTRAHSGYVIKMDAVDCEPDPFSKEGLWKLSRFSIEALQPLEALPWNAALPGTDQLARPIPGH